MWYKLANLPLGHTPEGIGSSNMIKVKEKKRTSLENQNEKIKCISTCLCNFDVFKNWRILCVHICTLTVNRMSNPIAIRLSYARHSYLSDPLIEISRDGFIQSSTFKGFFLTKNRKEIIWNLSEEDWIKTWPWNRFFKK